MTQIIDGKLAARKIRHSLQDRIEKFQSQGARAPHLAVILVGSDPASKVYVKHKERACLEIGMTSQTLSLESSCSEAALIKLIEDLNRNPDVDGILLQLPLPKHLNKNKLIGRISAPKDVDGLGAKNQGLLALNLPGLRPCTPSGILELIKTTSVPIPGKRVAVIGRSILVGSPISKMLTHADATVWNIHSKTIQPEKICKEADIVIAAAGQAELVDEQWVKEGSIVIDVGIHRQQNGQLVGDVAFSRVQGIASHISPVPGGVGPMTIAFLLKNCMQAYEWRQTGDHPYLLF